jgi:signal transduction histidine kinase
MLAMKLNLQALERYHRALKHSDEFRSIISQAEEVTDKLRQAAHNLMPASLQEQGLIDTIRAFINRVDNHKLQFSFLYYGKVPDLSEGAGKIILMITLELIQNILKHARATEALVQFNFFEDSMSITVEDNGIGIGNDYQRKRGMGLANIEANVEALNGTLDIKSSEYTGTTTLIEIPLNEHTLQNGKPGGGPAADNSL